MCSRDKAARPKINMLLTQKNIQEIKDFVSAGICPTFKTRFQKRDFKKKAKMFLVTGKGILIREVSGFFLVAVGDDDTERIERVCRYAHDRFGHSRADSSWKRLRMHWMGFKKIHLINWISKCPVCMQGGRSASKKQKPEEANQIFTCCSMERLQIDCISMIKYAEFNEEYSYILHIMDVYSRYHFACPLKKKDTSEICSSLSEIFEKEGWPHILQSDGSAPFLGADLSNLLVSNKVLHVHPLPDKEELSLMIIKETKKELKNKIKELMKSRKCEYSWITVIKDAIFQWNNEFLTSIMAKPNALFRKDPPNIDLYMQSFSNSTLPSRV